MEKSLAYSEGWLIVAEDRLTYYRGKLALTAFPVSEIRTLTIQEAKAFRHPLLGLVFAVALLLFALVAAGIFLVNPAGRFTIRLLGGSCLCLVLGVVILFDVLRSPRICWLRVRARRGGQWLALPGVDRQEVEELIQDLRRINGSIT